jgi:hypothetical protein
MGERKSTRMPPSRFEPLNCRPRERGDPYAVSFGTGRAGVARLVHEPLTSVVMDPRLREDDRVVSSEIQTAVRIPARRFRLRAMLHSLALRSEGARNAGLLPAHGPPCRKTKHRAYSPRNRRTTPAFRARCLRLAPHTPGGQTIFTHRCVTRCRRAGTDAAWAFRFRCHVSQHNRPPHPAPRIVTIAIRPSGGTGCGEYSLRQGIRSRTIFTALRRPSLRGPRG